MLPSFLHASNLECSNTHKCLHRESHSEPPQMTFSRPMAGSGGERGSARANLPRAGCLSDRPAMGTLCAGVQASAVLKVSVTTLGGPGGGWGTPLLSALQRQRQVDICDFSGRPGLHGEFRTTRAT